MLGYTNFTDLKYVCQLAKGLPNKIENVVTKCEICIQNKMTNLRFKNSRTKANNLLDIVHGPILLLGINGEKYFALLTTSVK